MTALINELAAEPDAGQALLVLDDYHLIDSETVHASLGFLLEHRPPGLRLVLASRSDPPLALARLRGRGQLAELRAAELRFTADEAAALLRQGAAGPGAALPDTAVAALAARTEGWAAGLQLAALSLLGQPDAARFVAEFTGSHRYVLDFLTEEVLEHQSEQVRTFLLETSVLERLSGPLCDAVTGRPGGQELLEQVERAGLFLVPLDEVRGWWRYHHLFADLLRVRLQEEQPGLAARLHRNAAAWYAERGLADDAIRHAVAAGEMTWAARLIEQDFDMVYNVRGEGATIQRWFSALPADLVQSRPRLLLVQALLMATSGRLDAVDALLDAAERADADAVDEPFEPTVGRAASMLVNVPAYIAIDRSYLAQLRGDAEGTAAFAAQALAVIGEGERLLDSVARWQLAIAAWLGGRLAEAERALVDGIAGLHAAGLLAVAASSVYELGQVQRARGRLDAAVQACQQALEVTVVPGRPPRAAAGPAYVGLGELAYERNEMEIALQHVTEGIALCRQWVYTTQLAAGLVTLAWIRQAAGDPAGALDAIGEAVRVAPGPPRLVQPRPGAAGAAAAGPGRPRRGRPLDERVRPRCGRRAGLWPGAGTAGAGPGAARPGAARPGACAAGSAVRGRGRPGPDRQRYRGRGAAGAGAGGQRRGIRSGGRSGRCAYPGLPAGIRPDLRGRGEADGRAAGSADHGPAGRAGRRRGPAGLPGPAPARIRLRTRFAGPRAVGHQGGAWPGRGADRTRA